MIAREQLKTEIERMDESYLDLAFKIISQFPHTPINPEAKKQKAISQISHSKC